MDNSGIKKIFLLFIGLMVNVGVANASDANWHTTSDSYQAYLGVVPADYIKKNPYLVDREKSMHTGVTSQDISAQHVMVSIFNKKENQRILDATVIAKVKYKKLLGGKATIKPLEKMVAGGTVTYGNFFSMPNRGEYEIEIKIYETNRNGSEEMEFLYKR